MIVFVYTKADSSHILLKACSSKFVIVLSSLKYIQSISYRAFSTYPLLSVLCYSWCTKESGSFSEWLWVAKENIDAKSMPRKQ